MANICSYTYDPNILTQAKVNAEFALIHKNLCFLLSSSGGGLSQVTTTNSSSLSFTGLGTAGSPLTGTSTATLQQVLTNGNTSTTPIYLNSSPLVAQSVQFFGDSITFGTAASSTANRWTTVLSHMLGVTEVNNGISGTTLEKQTPLNPLGGSPNMVDNVGAIVTYSSAYRYLVFAFGVNDIGYNATNYNATNFQTDYTTVINAAIAKGWPVGKIVILSTYYLTSQAYSGYATTTGTPAANIARSQAFNTAAQAVATSFGTIFIDIYDAQANSGYVNEFFNANAIHPQDDGHRFIAQYVFTQLGGSSYQNGQTFVANGPVSVKNLQLTNLAVAATPMAPLALDYNANVVMLDTNGLIRNNNTGVPDAGNISLYGSGYFGGVTSPDVQSLQVLGGSKMDGIRVSSNNNTGSGAAMELAFLSNTGVVFAYNRTTSTGLNLNLGFGFSPNVIVGANTVTGSQPFQVNPGSYFAGTVGIKQSVPTSYLHLGAGAAGGQSSPLKFTSGTNLTTAETGAVEYNGTNLFFTRTGTTRESVLTGNDAAPAPATSAGSSFSNFYGANSTNVLGTPNSWVSVVINGTTYKLPLYT